MREEPNDPRENEARLTAWVLLDVFVNFLINRFHNCVEQLQTVREGVAEDSALIRDEQILFDMRLGEALNECDGLRRVDEKKKKKKSDVVIALEVVKLVEVKGS